MAKGERAGRGVPSVRPWVAMIVGVIILLFGPWWEAEAANLLGNVQDQEINQMLRIKVGRSKRLRFPFSIVRYSVANPEVADALHIVEPGKEEIRELYINGLEPGVTTLSLWGAKGRFSSITVAVEADVTLLKEKFYQVLPKEKISVEAAGDSVVLSGEVSNTAAQATALALAVPFAGKKEKVVNLLHVGGVQQVMVEVRIAEINRTMLDRMGVNAIAISKSGNFGVSQIGNLQTITSLVHSFNSTAFTQTLSPNLTALAGWKAGGLLWTMFFDVLKQNQLGRLLAEPNLITTSGQEASFLAGGEFPYPVPQASGGGTTITIEWKKFGVLLNFIPTVLNDGKIAMRISPEVSQLDFGTALIIQGFTLPGLKVRRMTTQVEVKDGQTLAIAGLLNDEHRNIVNKFPVLGDIPILGTLFRSSTFQKNETELVGLVTPHLVKPMTPDTPKLPTDAYIEPSDYEFYLLGLTEGRGKKKPDQPAPAKPAPAGFGRQPVN